MKVLRRCLIAFMDLVIIFFIVRAYYIDDGTSDVFGLFVLIAIFFFVVYNLYGWLVYALFAQIKHRHALIEAGFFLLMLLPFYILWRFFH